ncbi:MAG: hypothetical protein IJK26_10110 [Clostridia bacterium]|nr:hypothetical protein [Clostridia bacterium]
MADANNPKFIAYVNLLQAMCDEGILSKDPNDANSILVYRTNMDESIYGVSEGWFSQNIFDAAQEVFDDVKRGVPSLLEALEESGFEVAFTESGDFEGLYKKDKTADKDISD